ncbi:hypothetical protein PCC79_16570 [Propioniciclava soli]|uniref:Uncharacterized protein n=1 Tax=Propioniciclava soli TaxID=2775081 RepID=A0ABZ3C769_9ACTN
MSDPITTRPARSRCWGLLLKAAVVVPELIIASLLWLVIIALLPPGAGFVLTVGGLIFAVVLAVGLGEDLTVRVLYRARRATPAEAQRLAAAWRIATHQLDADGVRLRIVSHGPPVSTAGRCHVLLRKDVVAAYCTNQVAAHQVAAMIAQGFGCLRHGHTRFDLLWTFWTIPWDLVRGLAHGIGRRLAWIPLVQFAWRIRLVVGSIAVILETQAGRWPSAIIIFAFIALSYVLPRSRSAWNEYVSARLSPSLHRRESRWPAFGQPR